MKLISSKLGASLLKTRVSKGYSQTYVAQHLGESQKTYSNIEAGKCRLDLLKFLKIAECLEKHPMYFIDKIIEGNPAWGCIDQKEKELTKENEKLKAEITYLKSINSFNQNAIIKKLEKILYNQESLIPM